ncbi:hypothetical protein [Gelidibacter japonicus]|uniref:hypothetical protein n=1 Tax=Gelidibacter japonicus TaxID=1962232 RepID=UPI003A924C4C
MQSILKTDKKMYLYVAGYQYSNVSSGYPMFTFAGNRDIKNNRPEIHFPEWQMAPDLSG